MVWVQTEPRQFIVDTAGVWTEKGEGLLKGKEEGKGDGPKALGHVPKEEADDGPGAAIGTGAGGEGSMVDGSGKVNGLGNLLLKEKGPDVFPWPGKAGKPLKGDAPG